MKLTGKECHDTFRDWDITSLKKSINGLENQVNAGVPNKEKFTDGYFYNLAIERTRKAKDLLLKRKQQLELLQKFKDFQDNYKGDQNPFHVFIMLERFVF